MALAVTFVLSIGATLVQQSAPAFSHYSIDNGFFYTSNATHGWCQSGGTFYPLRCVVLLDRTGDPAIKAAVSNFAFKWNSEIQPLLSGNRLPYIYYVADDANATPFGCTPDPFAFNSGIVVHYNTPGNSFVAICSWTGLAFWGGATPYAAPSEYWHYGDGQMPFAILNPPSDFSHTQRVSLVAHEFAHTLGLYHRHSNGSVMCDSRAPLAPDSGFPYPGCGTQMGLWFDSVDIGNFVGNYNRPLP